MISKSIKKGLLCIGLALMHMSTYAQSVEITSPSSVAGFYDFGEALFGQSLNPCDGDAFEITGMLANGVQADGSDWLCAADGELSDLTGNIALITRGDCNFTEKTLAAQNAGAIAVIICNNEDSALTLSGEDEAITIAAVILNMTDCGAIRAAMTDGDVSATIRNNSIGPDDENPDDVVLWSTTFPDGLDGWTSEGLLCTDADNSNAVWEWAPQDNFTRGGFAAGVPLESYSPCDGAVVFDSDFLDNGGDQAAQGAGTCPQLHSASLTSPAIDLSAYTFEGIPALKFSNQYIKFDAVHTVSWSTDGGTTWTDRVVNSEGEVNALESNIQRFSLANVSGDDTVILKFTFDGDYYYWGIDDVQIIDLSGVNAEIFNVFYTPLSYAVPIDHADADTFFFFSEVINRGSQELISVKMDVDIVNDGTGDIIESFSGSVNNVAVGDTASIAISELYVPNNLDIGVYRMDYSISTPDQSETVLSDNEQSFIFEITENTFGKDNGVTSTATVTTGNSWAAAVLYKLSDNATDVTASTVDVYVDSDAGTLIDNYIQVFVLELNDDVFDNSLATFDFGETDVASHPSFTLVGDVAYVFADEEPGQLFSIPLTEEVGAGFPLQAGKAYMIYVLFDSNQQGQAAIPNNELFLGFNDNIRGLSISDFIIDVDAGQWFGGLTSADPAPVIRLNLGVISPTDEIRLADNVFTVFPNPADSYIEAEISFDEVTDASLIMATIDGKIISIQDIKNATKNTQRINVKNMPNGTYLLKLQTNKGSRTQKVIVQH